VSLPIGSSSCLACRSAARGRGSWWSLSRQKAAPPKVSVGGTNAVGGAYRDRTGDLMLAKHALSQLS
jgi:hypothetical protein